MKRSQPVITIEFLIAHGYRAEVWIRPYRGRLLAMTEWTTFKASAVRMAKRLFPQFEILK